MYVNIKMGCNGTTCRTNGTRYQVEWEKAKVDKKTTTHHTIICHSGIMHKKGKLCEKVCDFGVNYATRLCSF